MQPRSGFILLLVLMLLGLQHRLWFGEGSYSDLQRLSQKVAQAQVSNVVREQRNRVLRIEVRDLKSGDAAMEEKARSELGLIKPGETFFMLVEKDTP
ncbi:MAG: septum formation initiator family protein [Pseudomonadales bacterium]|nr:septum formation initiator family protein [Pseudomonadales bacterium]